MGIESREYLRDDDDGGWGGGPSSAPAPMSMVTKIIIVTAIVYLLQLFSGSQRAVSVVTEWSYLSGERLFSGQVWRLLTYAFVHSEDSLLHIVFNMLMLYFLGRAAIRLTGEREFVWFYCASAVFAGICSVCFYMVIGQDRPVVGASGAVLAVFMLFTMHYPRQKLAVFGVLEIETRWLLAIYVVVDALPVINELMGGQPATEDRVAHSTHLGGLLFAWLYVRWNMNITAWWDRTVSRTAGGARRKKSGLKVFNPESQPEPDLSKRVDEILKKISEHGEESLTSRERRILRQASEQMKKRR